MDKIKRPGGMAAFNHKYFAQATLSLCLYGIFSKYFVKYYTLRCYLVLQNLLSGQDHF